jgi:hypothetical protein
MSEERDSAYLPACFDGLREERETDNPSLLVMIDCFDY